MASTSSAGSITGPSRQNNEALGYFFPGEIPVEIRVSITAMVELEQLRYMLSGTSEQMARRTIATRVKNQMENNPEHAINWVELSTYRKMLKSLDFGPILRDVQKIDAPWHALLDTDLKWVADNCLGLTSLVLDASKCTRRGLDLLRTAHPGIAIVRSVPLRIKKLTA